jgi:hypothetical protein
MVEIGIGKGFAKTSGSQQTLLMNMNKYVLFSMLALLIGNVFVWFQINGQLVWKTFQNNNLALCLAGVPIAYLFIKATEWGYQGFGEKLWPLRIMSIVIGMTVFSLMTGIILHEVPDTKTIMSLILCVIVLAIQVFL